MTLTQMAFLVFGAHALISGAVVLMSERIPILIQCLINPGFSLLRPMAKIAERFGVASSFPLALSSGIVCLLLGSSIWTAIFVLVRRAMLRS
jgi:hypothetical protein